MKVRRPTAPTGPPATFDGVITLNSFRTSIGAMIGSLRQDSFNRWLFNALVDLAPENVDLFEIRIGHLPHYNEDLEHDLPREVAGFREAVSAADGILFISPEYNHSLPGVIKNAIDWGSRPYPRPPLWDKPGAILGASSGRSGTMRAQLAFRQILPVSNVHLMNKPDVYVTFAEEKFDASGRLVDPVTIDQVSDFLVAFESWTRLIVSETRLAVS